MELFADAINNVPLMCGGIVSFELVRATEFALDALPIPFEAQLKPFVRFLVGTCTATSITLPAWCVVVGWKVIGREAEIAVDDARVGQGIVGIDFDGVAEVLDRLFDALSCVSTPVVAALKVGLVGLRAFGISSGNALLFSAG